jgi:hypothetical protein
MIYQLGDRNILFDSGRNEASDILQRREGDEWRDYMPKGQRIRGRVDFNQLPPGHYRMVSAD